MEHKDVCIIHEKIVINPNDSLILTIKLHILPLFRNHGKRPLEPVYPHL